jgi:IS1 family transposase
MKSGRSSTPRIKNVATAKAAPGGSGDAWTWTVLDADSKLIASYFVGDRSGQSAIALMDDLRSHLRNRVQLTTDGHRAWLEAVEGRSVASAKPWSSYFPYRISCLRCHFNNTPLR